MALYIPAYASLTPADDESCDSALERLNGRLLTVWNLVTQQIGRPEDDKKWGVVYASTKGCIEDLLAKPTRDSFLIDPLTPVLESFLKTAAISPALSLCVSNACASSHGAFFIAQKWIEKKLVDHVLVLAADFLGPFIREGFKSLGALSPTGARPFSKDRDGLTLGEAATAFVFSKTLKSQWALSSVALDTEGYAITRPSPSGKSLERACRIALGDSTIDAIVAHGTATRANDSAEDAVFKELQLTDVPVTGVKWRMGHTLGASGSIDTVAAIEMLKSQTVFPIGSTKTIDPTFRCSYVTGAPITRQLTRILVTSLGFGGSHAAAVIERVA